MSPLPLRPESLVTKAMDGASSQVKERLHNALKHFIERTRELTYEAKIERAYDSFSEHRKLIALSLKNFEEDVAEAREVMDLAFAEYDLDVLEIEAWMTAARAGDRVAVSAKGGK